MPYPPVVDRFVAKITVGSFVPELQSCCWDWTGSKSRGYGRFQPPGFYSNRAYRWSYEYHVDKVPQGLELDHLCRNRSCVNPWHLEPVTHAENHRRRQVQVCKWGHPMSGDNLRTRQRGNHVARDCVACTRKRAIAQHKRKVEDTARKNAA